MKKMYASLLSCDILNIREEVRKLKEAGIVSLHLDIMDGVGVENIFLGEKFVKKIAEEFPDLEIECHLMVQNPLNIVKNLDTKKIKRIIVHNNIYLRELGVYFTGCSSSLGVALSPHDAIDTVAIPPNTEKLLIMGVLPGKGGQSLLPCTLRRLREAKEKYPHLVYGIDGGINQHTIRDLLEADEFVLGSCLFREDPKDVLREISEVIQNKR